MVKTTWIGDVQNGQHTDQTVELKGWVKRSRGNNNIWFVVLRDSTGTIQCVGKKKNLGDEMFETLKGAIIETSAVFTGHVRADERAEGGHELDIVDVEIVGAVNSERPFPIGEADMLVEDEDGELTYGGDRTHPQSSPPLLANHTGHHHAKTPKFSLWCHSQLLPRTRFLGIPSTEFRCWCCRRWVHLV